MSQTIPLSFKIEQHFVLNFDRYQALASVLTFGYGAHRGWKSSLTLSQPPQIPATGIRIVIAAGYGIGFLFINNIAFGCIRHFAKINEKQIFHQWIKLIEL